MMTLKQDFALKIYRATLVDRASIRDTDLARLVEHWPWLRDMCEEIQHLRDTNERLSEDVEIMTSKISKYEE